MELKPDAFVDIVTARGRYQYFIEVDRGSEKLFGNLAMLL